MSDQLLAVLTQFHRETLLPHFQRIEMRLDGLETRLDSMDKDYSTRFDGIDAKFRSVDARFDMVDARFRDVDARFDAIDARFRDVDGHFDSVYERFDRLETEYHMLVAAVRRVEDRE